MADYNCWIRTNYFGVNDENALRELINRCSANGEMKLYSEMHDGKKKFCFTCNGTIYGLTQEEESEEDFDTFVAALQGLLPVGEAILLQEVGYEKFRYLVGSVLIITHDSTRYIDMKSIAMAEAKKILNDPTFTTEMDY